MANKIGCKTGRVTVIDPNNFEGFNSNSNMSVPLEDLNISVVLKTFRKGRTVLSKTSDGGARESSQTVAINFIEGSELGGEKVLTTKYTDLTTVFEADTVNSETLGITNIDIDFNPSMAPMITINFIDVRGSSIFQNEQNISANNNGNKYSTFFQLPYPLFELTIKGYYGRPVTYCLHMLKFNSKFNSKTGNFEIQCQFIGYTYAMLSDLLIGYLKAIPYTKIGKEKYEAYNKTRTTPILNLNELMKRISDINEGVAKISTNSESAKSVNTVNEALESLDKMKGVINSFGVGLDYDSTEFKDEYMFILSSDVKTQTEIDAAINHYKDVIKANIEEFNTLAVDTVSLSFNDFNDVITTGLDKGYFTGIKKSYLLPTDTTIDNELKTKIGSENGKIKFKKELLSFINRYYQGQADDLQFNVYNMTAFFDKINKTKVALEAVQEEIKKDLANELKNSFRDTLGFEPTVRNIVEIFTVAIEIMMETIYTVSSSAEAADNTPRITELERVFKTDLVKSSDIKTEAMDRKKFFAWPDYKEKDGTTNTFVNKYLGAPNVLEDPYKVDELIFIDDLLRAFIIAQQESNEVAAAADAVETTWFPVNVFDTKLFVDKEPYLRTELKNDADIVRMMVQRGMTFLGYTNNPSMFDPENKEIIAMAQNEADAILRVIKNPQLIQSLTQITPKFIEEIGISTGANYDPLLKKIGDKYVYNYPNAIGSDNDPNHQIIIPMSDNFSGYWPLGDNQELKKMAENGTIFLSNYSADKTNFYDKKEDGSVYVKLLTPSEYKTNVALYQSSGVTTESIFSYQKMSDKVVDISAGYNSFGGPLGIEDYSNLDYGVSYLNGLPMMYSFYKGEDYTGLAYNRKDSGQIQGTVNNSATDSYYDFKDNNGKVKSKVLVFDDKDRAYESKSEDFKLHAGLGKNWELFVKYKNGSPVSYPYIEQRYSEFDNSGKSLHNPYHEWRFSLFGSKWYYFQNYAKVTKSDGTTINASKYAKAILFLQTMPFNYVYDKETYVGPLRNGDPFNTWEIRHMFNKKGGFIHSPRLWCAHLGSIFWYMDNADPVMDGNEIVGGGSGVNWPINWQRSSSVNFVAPSKGPDGEYFPPVLNINNDDVLFIGGYPDIRQEDVVRRVPTQVRNAFKQIFFDFVNGNGDYISFDDIRNGLEIWDENASAMDFETKLDSLFASMEKNSNGYYQFNSTLITNNPNFKNIDNYQIITIVDEIKKRDAFFLELRGDTSNNSAMKKLVDAMSEEMIIANGTYKIWQEDDIDEDGVSTLYDGLTIPKDKFEVYFSTLINTLKTKGDVYSPSEVRKQIEQQIFGTTDENVIKLILYNTCKNIHDKWLAGVTDPDNLIFQCGDSTSKPIRNISDSELANKYGNSKPRLIDSFRFVSRSFKDIGDKLYINPLPVNNYLVESPNTSSYDAISNLLDSNKFTFDALPTFINFRDPQNVESIFEPMPNYELAIENGSCGPTFVCVYAGQTSKHLDFANSDYDNDGFDFGCIGQTVAPTAPNDFTEDIGGGEDPIAVFKVVYGQQNQNIFKDIVLDQSEFSETDESLQIQDQLSTQLSETNRSLAGQNIYNVYSVRSYSAEIEMLGNPMIQPMMYFQLDNIPMFHGAYMVTRVKHAIKPNHMSTNFTGVRIRYAETPLITAMDLYMSMVNNMDTSGAGTGTIGSGSEGFVSAYQSDLISNKPKDITIIGTLADAKKKLIAARAEQEIKNWNNGKLDEKEGVQFLDVYAKTTPGFAGESYANNTNPWSAIFISYIAVAGDTAFPKATSHYNYLTAGMKGDNGYEVFPLNSGLKIKAEIGDIINCKRSGGYTASHSRIVYKIEGDKAYAVGGNESDSIRIGEYNLTNGYFTDATNFGEYKLLMKQTGNKYYEKKKLIGTGVHVDTPIGTEKSTKINEAEREKNQIYVKNFLKGKGLTKQQVAGVMGNIQQESQFNPMATNQKDLNGYPSLGLIQWNGKFYPKPNGSKNVSTVFDSIGRTVEEQMNSLINMPTYTKFIGLSEPKVSVEEAAYQFANLVEVCHKCNLGYNTYKGSYQYVRTQYANNFFKRFNDSKDKLAW